MLPLEENSVASMVEIIEKATFDELVPIIQALAKKIYAHRQANKGFVPISVFEYLIGMSGAAVSVQIVHEVHTRDSHRLGFALKLREAEEAGEKYRGKYHNTCCSFRMYDTPETALGRDTADAFGDKATDVPPVEFLGVTIHHEEARRGADVTMMHLRIINEDDLPRLTGQWKVFTEAGIRERNREIVFSNCEQLEWVMDPDRPMFADIRGGWPKH